MGQDMKRSFEFVLTCRLVVIVCLTLLSAGSMVSNAGHENAEEILRSRMPKESEKFSQRVQSNSIALESSHDSLYQAGAKKSEGNIAELVKKHGPFYLIKIEQKDGDKRKRRSEYCYGLNSKYCFELKKSKQGSTWILSKVVFVKSDDFDDTKQGFSLPISFRTQVDESITILVAVEMVNDKNVMPHNLFELPGFMLKSVTRDEDDENILRAKFSYEITDPEMKKSCQTECILDFDIGMHCLPTKLHQTYKLGDKEVIHDWSRKWTKIDNDNYTLKRSIDTKTITNSHTKHLIRIRSDMKINTQDLPESDFTLSAFDFPEPPGVDWNKPFPWYLVVAGIGTACLGVFFLLRSRAKRLRGES